MVRLIADRLEELDERLASRAVKAMTTGGKGSPAMQAAEHERDVKAQLAAIVKTSHDAIIEKNLDGIITGWNPGAERLYGYVPAEVLGRHSRLLAHADLEASEAALLSRVVAGEDIEKFKTRRIHKSGAVLEVSLSVSPIVDDAKVIVGMVSASRDIGELALAHPRSQMLLDAPADAMICVDADGVIRLVNDKVQRLFGYCRSELLGKPISILGPSIALAFAPALLGDEVANPTIRASGGPAQLLAQRKDGTTFAADISLGSVDLDGSLIVTAAIRDVTELIAIQLALQESEALFRQLAASVNVAFLVQSWDPPTFLYVSPGYLKIFGYDPMVEGEGPVASLRWIHPEDCDRAMVEYWDRSEAGLDSQTEYRIVLPAGEVRWIRAVTTPVAGPSGAARRTANTLEDITDRKRAEAGLAAAAEATNAAKIEFLSRMSHELRTPLNAVLGFAQLLELDEISDQQRTAVEHILNGGRHLVQLIDDVLDIAKIDADQLDVSLEAVNISDLLRQTVALMAPMATSANVALRHLADPDPDRYVLADLRRLRQVMLNLLGNAIKYNRPGGRVTVRSAVAEDGSLDIVVEDTGTGIRTEDLPRLFTPFDRLVAKSSGIEGTGVGLALSQRLMNGMGGALRVSSQIGVGTSFTASVPLTTPPGPQASADAVSAGAATVAHTFASRTKTVIYIEDNNSNIDLLEQLIKLRPDWHLTVARTAAAGLALVTSTPPDLLLLDLHLPDLNGIDVLRRLRAEPRTGAVPVAVVSADASPLQIKRLVAAGALAYLTKPLAVDQMLALLDSFAADHRKISP